jgi:ribosomal-protein-alanine N-acetyltransferase
MQAIETPRLVLRNFRPDDWQAVQELSAAYAASEISQYDQEWPTSREEVVRMVEWLASGDDFVAACLKDTGRLIGLVAIQRRKEREGRVHGLGYVFHPTYHGQGYATEACRAAIDHLFGELEADRVESNTAAVNEPSCRLLRRLGMVEVGRHTASFRTAEDGTPIEFEAVSFAMSREAWARLAAKRAT